MLQFLIRSSREKQTHIRVTRTPSPSLNPIGALGLYSVTL